jgi:hypothetical protein
MNTHILVSPLHDPAGILLPHLLTTQTAFPRIYTQTILSVSPITRQKYASQIAQIRQNEHFSLLDTPNELTLGDEFRQLYHHAAKTVSDDAILHLGFIDRVLFALQPERITVFKQDVWDVDSLPLMFHRSERAWETHPNNYRAFEEMVTITGKWLFGKTLDFAWCYMMMTPAQLRRALAKNSSPHISMLAEMAVALRDEIRTKDVDWLAWEDPFLLEQDPLALKQERENSPEEIRKRLNYVIPMLEILRDAI